MYKFAAGKKAACTPSSGPHPSKSGSTQHGISFRVILARFTLCTFTLSNTLQPYTRPAGARLVGRLLRSSGIRLGLDGDDAAARPAQQLERQHVAHLRACTAHTSRLLEVKRSVPAGQHR